MAASPRVLVIRGGAIGDFVLTLPAIRMLRASIAGCHLEVLGYPGIVDLAVTAGLADAVRSLEHRTMAPLFAKGAAIDESLCDYFRSFNLVVSFLYDPDGFLRENMQRTGVRTWIEVPHRVEEGKGHAAEQLARPLEKLAMFLDDPAPVLLLQGDGEAQGAPSIVVHPGSGSIRKNWPVENWIRTGREIGRMLPEARLVLVTGEAERERGVTALVARAWSGLDFIHYDSLPLPELARRLAGCQAFLGHDSGISHLAAACGVPALLFFGPTDPATWAPRNAGVSVHRPETGDLSLMSYDQGWEAIRAFFADKIF